MTKVTAQMSVSLDGYTGPLGQGDPKDTSGWMQGPEAPGFFRVTRWAVDAMAWRAAGPRRRRAVGQLGDHRGDVRGRRVPTSWVGACSTPARSPGRGAAVSRPVRPHPIAPELLERHGGTSFTSSPTASSGPSRWPETPPVARTWRWPAAEILRQVLAAGCSTTSACTSPRCCWATASACSTQIGLGAGEGIELVPTRVVEAPEVTHIRYTVSGPSKLVLDDRGASGDLVGPAQPKH